MHQTNFIIESILKQIARTHAETAYFTRNNAAALEVPCITAMPSLLIARHMIPVQYSLSSRKYTEKHPSPH